MRYAWHLVCRASLMLLFVLSPLALVPDASAQYFRFGKNKIQYEQHNWYYLQTRHFDIYFYEEGDDLADFTAHAAEEAYAELSKLFQYEISDRIPLLVYQSHNDFAVTNAVDLPTYAEGIGGATELFKNRIAVPFTGDYRDFRRVVHHEIVHAVLNDMFYGGSIQSILQNNIRLQIPLWFNEGLAEYAALGWDTESDMYMREAILSDNLPPIPFLRGYFAYRGGQSVWDYIGEQYGREKIAEILRRVRTTRSVEQSFKRATGLTLEELSEQWHRALRKVHFPETAARQDLDEIARTVVAGKENGGSYNTSPALSPKGDRLAYITTTSGLFDVYLADANTGETIRKLVDGQTSPAFESLRILTPGLTWSPDGEKIALAVKSGPSDAIVLVDVATGELTHYRIPNVDQITTVAWSPKGDRIAFSASMNAQSDIFVLSLSTRSTTNFTNDIFSDHEPSWSPDGRHLVFHSDRGPYAAAGQHQAAGFDMMRHDFSQLDVYRLELERGRIERLTFNQQWDDKRARYAGSPDRIVYLSDRNGIYNLYERNLTTGTDRALTNLLIGATHLSVSADGQKAAVTELRNGTPSIYIVNLPFSSTPEQQPLLPNVWAQRANSYTKDVAPALALAPSTLKQTNPFLRDARRPAASSSLPQIADSSHPSDTSRGTASPGADLDTTAYGTTRVDFRNYVFGERVDQPASEGSEASRSIDPFSPTDNRNEDGSYRARPYKLKFSPDIVTSATSYDVLYGMQGAVQMQFSDMLGNHRLLVSSNLRTDLRNSNYYLAYNYLPRRLDWSFFGYHTSLLLRGTLRDRALQQFYRYRRYGSGISLSYPIDKFRRVDFDMSAMGIVQTEITDLEREPITRFLYYPALSFTKDVTTPGLLTPSEGHRFAVSLSGSPGNLLHGRQVRFATLLGDARTYTSFLDGYYTLAVRLSGGTSLGPDRQLFFTSGVQNWINRQFDAENGLPIETVTDISFATPVLPLRGHPVNARNGSNFGLLNVELRMPLVAAVLPGPLPILPLYNLQAATFLDAGSVWGGRSSAPSFRLFGQAEEADRRLEDLLIGAGFGLRTVVFGLPVRLDFAWPFDGRELGDRQTHLSLGVDF